MAWIDAFAPALAEHRARVYAETWGHLAPVFRRKYAGSIVFTHGDYGDIVPIKADFPDLPDSPWFFDDMIDFICNRVGDDRGIVYRFVGTYAKCKNGKAQFFGRINTVKI